MWHERVRHGELPWVKSKPCPVAWAAQMQARAQRTIESSGALALTSIVRRTKSLAEKLNEQKGKGLSSVDDVLQMSKKDVRQVQQATAINRAKSPRCVQRVLPKAGSLLCRHVYRLSALDGLWIACVLPVICPCPTLLLMP